MTPSVRRTPPEALCPRVKTHNYLNLVAANLEIAGATRGVALLLDTQGNLAGGAGATSSWYRRHALHAARAVRAVGISRDTVMDLAREAGLTVVEKDLDLFDAYNADEAFHRHEPLRLPGAGASKRPDRRRRRRARRPARYRGLLPVRRLRLRGAVSQAAGLRRLPRRRSLRQQGRRAQRPAHQLSRLGRGRRPADRVRARLHVERPGVQWAGPAPPGSVPGPVAPDVRGHGESAWSPAGAYQYQDQVGDLAALVDTLALGRFTLIGTSMGGIIAMAYAGAHPDPLQRLVLNYSARHRDRKPADHRDGREPTGGVRDARRGDGIPPPDLAHHGRTEARGSAELALGVLRQRPDGRWIWKMDPAYIQQRVKHGAPRRPDLWPV